MKTSLRRLKRFAVSRYGVPVEEYHVKHSVATGISFGNNLFPLWDAAVAAGATLAELQELDEGGKFNGKFMAKVLAYKRIKDLIELHGADAQNIAAEREMKRKRRG